jgi:tRNA modification GTPase
MSSSEFRTKYVTQMTADGPGAIAVLRIWGEGVVAVVDRLFRPRHGLLRLSDTEPGTLRLGWFGGDEVVAIVVPDDFAERHEIEIQGHGSPLLIDSLLRSLAGEGVVAASRDDYLKAHGVKRLERMAHEHLGRATTSKAAAVLYRQSCGALRTALESVAADLDLGNADIAVTRLDALLETSNWGMRLSSGFRVALAGPPNVGKSTLVNALAGFERTIVSPVPGTTRDAVDVSLVLGGWPIVLTDTAGLRERTEDPLEEAGMRLAREEHDRADLVLQLTECGETDFADQSSRDMIDVRTKLDLHPGFRLDADDENAVAVSAAQGDGLDELIRRITDRLIPVDASAVSAVAFDCAIAASLRQIRTAVTNHDTANAKRLLAACLEEDHDAESAA